jgi:hypothetical protein
LPRDGDAAALVPELAGEFVSKTLHLAINRQGTPFFWPVRLPSPDGKDMFNARLLDIRRSAPLRAIVGRDLP